jgi:NAD(P)H-dependent FMN reductase
MKKITAFIGSAQKRATYQAVQEFEKNLKQHGDIDFEVVFLSDCRLEFCRGCMQCFNKGAETCPLKDDRDALLKKLENSDGVIFATPSYAFQVSARMKNFLDRIAFVFHRPRFFGKTFTAIITQGVPIGGKIRKYLESSGGNLGFSVVKGSCVWTLAPMTEAQQKSLKQKMHRLAERFYKSLVRKKPPVPSFLRLMMFRMARTGLQKASAELFDFHHYQDKGWFMSDYYHETALGPIKKLAGYFFDFLGSRLF